MMLILSLGFIIEYYFEYNSDRICLILFSDIFVIFLIIADMCIFLYSSVVS